MDLVEKKYLPLNFKNHAVYIELRLRWALCKISSKFAKYNDMAGSYENYLSYGQKNLVKIHFSVFGNILPVFLAINQNFLMFCKTDFCLIISDLRSFF